MNNKNVLKIVLENELQDILDLSPKLCWSFANV